MEGILTGRDKQLLEVQAWLSQVEERLLRNAVELAEDARALQTVIEQLKKVE